MGYYDFSADIIRDNYLMLLLGARGMGETIRKAAKLARLLMVHGFPLVRAREY